MSIHEQLQEALAKAVASSSTEFAKAITFETPATATTGIQGYDLEPVAKVLYPVLTPLRNIIPRVSGKGGSQANWKAVTALNTGRVYIGVGEGQRGGVLQVQTKDYAAVYKHFGIESSLTFEADYSAKGFDDLRGRTAKSALESLMLGEEPLILGGNTSVALGTTPTPVLVGSGTGGTLAAATWSVKCVAMTLSARINCDLNNGLLGQYTRTNADGSTTLVNGGNAAPSAGATVVTTGSTSKITASVAAVRGAVAYAWYLGAAGSEKLAAFTGYPGAVLTVAPPTERQLVTAIGSTDASASDLDFDGLLTIAMKSGTGGYWLDRGGQALTPDGAGGIVEIDAVLKRYWDKLRMSPDVIDVSAQEMTTLTQAMLQTGGSVGAFRLVANIDQGAVMGGVVIATYLNKYAVGGAKQVKIRIHPNMPQGTILFSAEALPYPMAGINNLMQMKCRQDYYQLEWPLKTRKYEYGTYFDGVLQHYFPPSLAVLTGIGQYQETVVDA